MAPLEGPKPRPAAAAPAAAAPAAVCSALEGLRRRLPGELAPPSSSTPQVVRTNRLVLLRPHRWNLPKGRRRPSSNSAETPPQQRLRPEGSRAPNRPAAEEKGCSSSAGALPTAAPAVSLALLRSHSRLAAAAAEPLAPRVRSINLAAIFSSLESPAPLAVRPTRPRRRGHPGEVCSSSVRRLRSRSSRRRPRCRTCLECQLRPSQPRPPGSTLGRRLCPRRHRPPQEHLASEAPSAAPRRSPQLRGFRLQCLSLPHLLAAEALRRPRAEQCSLWARAVP